MSLIRISNPTHHFHGEKQQKGKGNGRNPSQETKKKESAFSTSQAKQGNDIPCFLLIF